MTIDTNDRVIEFSKFFDYQAYSSGYSWMQREHVVLINLMMDQGDPISDILNSSRLWNRIGSDIFNMPYIQTNGVYSFVIPDLSNVVEADVKRDEVIGKIVKELALKTENSVYFKNTSKFILYNDKIEVASLEEVKDANMANIIFNLVSAYILQTFKRGINK